MRSILVLGLVAVLAVAAVESLKCVQCNLTSDSCSEFPTSCPADSQSCGVTFASWPGGPYSIFFYEMFCSRQRAGSLLSFAVRMPGNQRAWFTNQLCATTDKCNMPLPQDFPENGTGNTQCPTCLAFDPNSCVGTNQTCNDGERCVDLLAELTIGGYSQQLALKGCSNINDAACNQLSKGNVTVGDIMFRNLTCNDSGPGAAWSPSVPLAQPPCVSTPNLTIWQLDPFPVRSCPRILGLLPWGHADPPHTQIRRRGGDWQLGCGCLCQGPGQQVVLLTLPPSLLRGVCHTLHQMFLCFLKTRSSALLIL